MPVNAKERGTGVGPGERGNASGLKNIVRSLLGSLRPGPTFLKGEETFDGIAEADLLRMINEKMGA